MARIKSRTESVNYALMHHKALLSNQMQMGVTKSSLGKMVDFYAFFFMNKLFCFIASSTAKVKKFMRQYSYSQK